MDNSYRERTMMLDPNTAKARIFVKNLPLTNVTKREVEEYFSRHGKVCGLLLQKHFSFIQFEDANSAAEAIEQENGQVFHGKIIEVAPARMPLNKDQLAAQRAQRGGGAGGVGRGRERDRSPVREDEADWREDPYDYDYRGTRGARNATSYREDEYYPAAPSASETRPPAADERTNDCEIIVHNKKQRNYAEVIERKLKNVGLTVDLLFPNESIPVTRVLANIASRGTLYAITVSPQNEEMHSLTLNILHGSPEEHRNMPLEQAVNLIDHNFEQFVQAGGQRKGSKPGVAPTPIAAVSVPAVITPHPEAIQVMLNLLAQNRALTVLQYDTMLKYLKARRDQQVKLELGDTNMAPPPIDVDEASTSSTSSNPQSEQLKNRILSIMDRTFTRAPPAPPAPPPAVPSWSASSSTSSATPILFDPQVQKALDNLFQGGNILDKIASSRK